MGGFRLGSGWRCGLLTLCEERDLGRFKCISYLEYEALSLIKFFVGISIIFWYAGTLPVSGVDSLNLLYNRIADELMMDYVG